jgi:hypothetical protein
VNIRIDSLQPSNILLQESAANRSIVMVDWSRFNEPTPGRRNQFLWHQMVLSLLYDDVVAQDETLVCSSRMSRWFDTPEKFRSLEQLFICGGIGVLKRPWQRYPAGRLQDLVHQKPITARREHLQTFSVNNSGEPLQFDEQQIGFHEKLEELLARQPHFHRYAGSQKKLGKDLMQEFGTRLERVLTDQRYRKWLQSKFKSITPQTVDDFVQFIHEPEKAIEYLKRTRLTQPPKFTPLPGVPTFNTALAVQVAATYEKEARDLQDLVETVFAAPFCEDEGADGRYSKSLRDLPVPLNENDADDQGGTALKVELSINVPLMLPLPGSNFGEIIQKVRESETGRTLRQVMSKIGNDYNFENVKDAWKAVAQEIAPMVGRNEKQISVTMMLMTVAKETFWGAVTDFMAHPQLPTTKEELLQRSGPLLRGLSEIGGEMFSKVRQRDLERQRISSDLENMIDFNLVRHPIIERHV